MEFLSMIMLALVVIAGVVLLVLLLGLPGYIARRRGHEAAKAIHLCGLLGGLFFFPLWIVALVWHIRAKTVGSLKANLRTTMGHRNARSRWGQRRCRP